MGSFVKASIGLRDDLTYSNDSIGNSIKTLIEISEGKHFFCQQLVKAKRPFIVLGSAVKKRLDSNALSALIEKLSTYSKVVDEDWLGVNFLSSQANTVGSNLVGISQKNKIKTTDKTWKFIYCVGLNSIEKKSFFSADSLKNSFVVLQTSFAFSSLLKIKKGLLLPATTFAEKIGTFVNVEGRMQKTSAALVSPALAQDDLKIVNALFSKFCRDEILFSSVKNNLDFNSNKNTFVKNMLIPFCKETPQKIMKTPLTVLLSNFFLSNQFTKNSLIMSKCSSLFKKNYVNFL
jgi:NADH-quinone oxidoreductase subunit G